MSTNSDTDRTVLITGAAVRIGRALARDFGTRGWRVGIHCHNSVAEADAVAEAVNADGGRAEIFQADLSDMEETGRLVARCADALGPPTCLINNASRFEPDELTTLTPADWDSHVSVNLRAPIFLAQAFAEALPATAHGNIINLIDQRVWKLTPGFFSYTASKAGLWTVTRTMAQALAPRIRVNAIGPGPTLASRHQTAGAFEHQRKATLLGHGATTEEVCRTVRFILDTPSLTGQMIALDGGQHLAWQTPDVTGLSD